MTPQHSPPALPQQPAAFLLDFDGVILQSVALKIQAFQQIYEGESPAKLAEVLAHQQAHGGVNRRVRFRHCERHIFGRSGDDAAVDRLSAEFTRRVHGAVLDCPFVPGAREFLEAAHARSELHVISGTSIDELKDIIERRGLARFFRSVHGGPQTKPDAFAQILERYGYAPSQALAVGDATTEFDAAVSLGIPFLGVVAEGSTNPFAQHVPTIATLETLCARVGLA
ncbi:MAG: HAD hydrolase-like protein [Casimicrobiaceae bacterium]